MFDRIVRHAVRLFGRFSWFRGIHHPTFMVALVRLRRSHWSGLQVRCWRRGETAGSLHVGVWRLSVRGVERLRAATVPLDAIEGTELCPVYWTPIPETAGLCLVTLRQRPSACAGETRQPGSPPLVFSWKMSGKDAIYSPPDSHLPLPSILGFSPVTQCNLNCIHCISRHSREQVAALGDESWDDIKAAAAAGHLRQLRTDYSGDVLFADRKHGRWLRRIEELDVSLGIDTHANDLTPDYVDRLLGSRLSFINFSLDSMDPEDYPRIRRGARPLPDVIANIRRFMTERHARRPDVVTLLSFVLMRRNIDSLRAAIDLAAEFGIDVVAGNHLHAYTPDMADESLMLEPERYARHYSALMEYARVRQVYLVLPPPVRRLASRRTHMPCPYPWESMVVLGNGDVMACCVPGTKVGNLRGSSLEQIWKGDAMRQFRARVNSDDPPDACSVCPMIRLPHNFASYVPGLPEHERQDFERRCLDAHARGVL
jgi:radical SAM protein with 4Fe4S-binding SPASM domain